MKTRDEARTIFAVSGLTYDDVTRESIQALRNIINRKMVESALMSNSFRCRQRPKMSRDGSAEISCKSHYFDKREAVTFNRDGFIGFAGWSDERNVQPILEGFCEWVNAISIIKDTSPMGGE